MKIFEARYVSYENLIPGLVSVTFRQLTPAEVIALAVQAGVAWIEWGGDVHVPQGDLARAKEVGSLTRAAGLTAAAYGSYYRVGLPAATDFEQTLASAVALGAPVIRVWTGGKSSCDISEEERGIIVEDSRRICEMAAREGIQIAYEFHGGTLTDSVEEVIALLSAVDRPNLRTLWQPLGIATPTERQAEVERLLPWLANVHVYHGHPGNPSPLFQGAEEWRAILDCLTAVGRPIGLLIEFVQEGAPEQFLKDAVALRSWLDAESLRQGY